MVSLLLTIMMMLTIPSVGNTNLFSTNTANAQEDYNDDKYGYYYYPPDYYKYECQKGPFEGDLVESVEFCFKKAHDRDDKQGDGEEDGPGPTGLFQINASNYYKQTGPIATIGPSPGQPVALSTALCLMEDVAISGEYEIIGGNATTPTVTLFESDPPSTWITFITGTAGQSVQIGVNCFDNPPLRP
jgi:hypothetical protein